MFMTVELPQFAHVLSRSVGRPALDKTGIAGRYFFQFEWALDPTQAGGVIGAGGREPATDANPSLFTALQEKFGLKLESQRSAIECWSSTRWKECRPRTNGVRLLNGLAREDPSSAT